MKKRQTYCGSALWVDHTREPPLANKLFEYGGSVLMSGKVYHRWRPYRRPGMGLLLTDEHISLNIKVFKPLILDCEEFYSGGKDDAFTRF